MIGHNSEVDGSQLRAFVERVERVQSDIDERNADKSEIYQEAKAFGYDTKILKKVVALRRMDRQRRVEEQTILDLYLSALGDE
jgi:uncharacterized protein (UPF0335 family)